MVRLTMLINLLPCSQSLISFAEAIYSRIASFIMPGSGCGHGDNSCGSLSPMYKRPFSLIARIENEKSAAEANTDPKTSTELKSAQKMELETIKALFLVPGAPKELNIPSSMRRHVLEAIETSTDAKHLAPVSEHCWVLLKSC